MGMLGMFNKSMSEKELFELIKKKLGTKFLKHSKLLNKPIKKIAVLGGSGSFAIHNAISKKVDAFLTADLKYHDYFKVENKILLVDIGHYESEQFTKNILLDILRNKFPNFVFDWGN
jgi:putative NIF3 family GTP cyclohydrolase 1 type 2